MGDNHVVLNIIKPAGKGDSSKAGIFVFPGCIGSANILISSVFCRT
jgi:hypothetical protein